MNKAVYIKSYVGSLSEWKDDLSQMIIFDIQSSKSIDVFEKKADNQFYENCTEIIEICSFVRCVL